MQSQRGRHERYVFVSSIRVTLLTFLDVDEPSVRNHVNKKRKLRDDDTVPVVDTDELEKPIQTVHTTVGWEQKYRGAKAMYLKSEQRALAEKERRLAAEVQLVEQKQLYHQSKAKHADRDDAHADTIDGLKKAHAEALSVEKKEARRVYQAGLKNEGKVVELQSKILQRDQTINELEINIAKLHIEMSRLQGATRQQPVAPRRRELTFVPDPNPNIHSHRDYPHPEAPRENAMYKRFVETHKYARGAGKVWPSKYGSGLNWDLGLCRITFDTRAVCDDRACEYRHHALTVNERTYMGLLGPSGPSFLEHSTECMRNKPVRSG
jgi:hypothetical protein